MTGLREGQFLLKQWWGRWDSCQMDAARWSSAQPMVERPSSVSPPFPDTIDRDFLFGSVPSWYPLPLKRGLRIVACGARTMFQVHEELGHAAECLLRVLHVPCKIDSAGHDNSTDPGQLGAADVPLASAACGLISTPKGLASPAACALVEGSSQSCS